MSNLNRKLNVFIDAGNVDKDTQTNALLSEIALVKNMDHVESVFVFAKNEQNKLKVAATTGTDALKDARAEYEGSTFIGMNAVNGKQNEANVIIYNSDNPDFDAKLKAEGDLKKLAENALMICVPDEKAELKVLSLFTHKTPTAFNNIQLVVPKGTKDNKEITKLHSKVMDMVKDAKRLRELKINILTGQTGGAFFGLFGKKKYDEKAAEIVKKIRNKDKKYINDGNVNMEAVKVDILAYYGYDSTIDKKTLSGSALKKWTEAKNNYARAYHIVKEFVDEAYTPKEEKPKEEKPQSFSTIRKMATTEKEEYKKKKKKERDDALAKRGLQVSNLKTSDNEAAKAFKLKKFENEFKVRKAEQKATNTVIDPRKGALGDADLIICHKDDETAYPANVPCIKYDDKSIDILDLLLTAQFSEPTRLRELFTKGKGTKKSSFRSQIKRKISRMGDIDIQKTRKARETSRERMSRKAKRSGIARTPLHKKKASNIAAHNTNAMKAAKQKVAEAVNTVDEAIKTKKAELKRAKFYQFTKKKQLQANIAELEEKLRKKYAGTAS